MTTLFALFAEVERELLSDVPAEGLAKARSSGKRLGRPKGLLGISRLDGKEDEIRHFLGLGVSKNTIPKITGVSRPTLYHFIDSLACKITVIGLVPLNRCSGTKPTPSGDPSPTGCQVPASHKGTHVKFGWAQLLA